MSLRSSGRWKRIPLVIAAAAMAAAALTGETATPQHHGCSPAMASRTCAGIDRGGHSTTPADLGALPHSDDPRWLSLGYNPKWPQLGYNPKWHSFGYEPQYKGFQTPRFSRRSRAATTPPPSSGEPVKSDHLQQKEPDVNQS